MVGGRDGRTAGRPTPRVGAGRRRAARVFFSLIVMTFAGGLVATIALPSYSFDPSATAAVQPDKEKREPGGKQRVTVGGDVRIAAASRDSYAATTSAELAARAAEKKRAEYAKSFASYSGPSADDYLANPGHPPFSLSAVYRTALRYQGVPYVFGGADPSGFDCSGYVMFVYAQYGVRLPHSVHMQDALGTRISQADAQPGDLVIFNDESHDGFYAGDGMILHAPYPGASVRVQPLWTSDVHFIRFGT
jgi:cell wall-associated NlpC family hydrolase